MCGYLSGLSAPSVTDDDHHPGRLAQVEQGRADQVADVLDEHDRAARRVERAQPVGHHGRVQVAARAGVDLHDPAAGGPDPLGVEHGLLVALDDRHSRAGQVADGALEQRGLAGARRAHQVERERCRARRATPGCARPARSFFASTFCSRITVVRAGPVSARGRGRGGGRGRGRDWCWSCLVAAALPGLRPARSSRRSRTCQAATITDAICSSSPASTVTSALPHGHSQDRLSGWKSGRTPGTGIRRPAR